MGTVQCKDTCEDPHVIEVWHVEYTQQPALKPERDCRVQNICGENIASVVREDVLATPRLPFGGCNVFGSKYVVKEKPMLLHLRGKIWDNYKNFVIVDDNGEAVFRTTGSRASASPQQPRLISDAQGTPLFALAEDVTSIKAHTCYFALSDGSKSGEAFRIESNLWGTAQYTCGLMDSKAQEIKLTGRLDLITSGRKGYIWLSESSTGDGSSQFFDTSESSKEGTLIARTSYPKQSPHEFESMEYYLEIVPGVDAALVLAFVLTVEEEQELPMS
jgi:hypothetical protein